MALWIVKKANALFLITMFQTPTLAGGSNVQSDRTSPVRMLIEPPAAGIYSRIIQHVNIMHGGPGAAIGWIQPDFESGVHVPEYIIAIKDAMHVYVSSKALIGEAGVEYLPNAVPLDRVVVRMAPELDPIAIAYAAAA